MTDDDPNEQMSEREFIAAQFFDAELPPREPKKPRKSRKTPPEILALRRFCRTIDPCSDRAKWAAVRWLVEVYGARREQPTDA